jgi:hypothetical protein
MFEQEVTLLCAEAYRPLESVHRRAESEPVTIQTTSGMDEVGPGVPSESLDGFVEVRESAVLGHDLILQSEFLEQEYSDYFCLL